jgi:hypothetical protein
MRAYLQRFTKAFDGFSAPLPNAQFHESFEYFGADWSSGVFEAFLKGRGYDLRTQLPAFAGAAPEDKVARGRSFALTPDFCRHPFGAPASVVCGRLDSP